MHIPLPPWKKNPKYWYVCSQSFLSETVIISNIKWNLTLQNIFTKKTKTILPSFPSLTHKHLKIFWSSKFGMGLYEWTYLITDQNAHSFPRLLYFKADHFSIHINSSWFPGQILINWFPLLQYWVRGGVALLVV